MLPAPFSFGRREGVEAINSKVFRDGPNQYTGYNKKTQQLFTVEFFLLNCNHLEHL
jgi:hypothetical protein